MAAITGITSDTTLANIINAEHISNTLKEIERAPVLAEMIADVRDASGTNALTYVFPKFSDLTLSYNEDSGFADDGDEVSASAQTPTRPSPPLSPCRSGRRFRTTRNREASSTRSRLRC